MEKNTITMEEQPTAVISGEETAVSGADPDSNPIKTKKVISVEGFMAIGFVLLIFIPIGAIMGFGNMLQTLFNNSCDIGKNLVLLVKMNHKLSPFFVSDFNWHHYYIVCVTNCQDNG